uniref:Uncharacterized protein n=1 Tax=Arundo donax TaxID=35708 RepID=A0A0A9EAJ1_ARUDO
MIDTVIIIRKLQVVNLMLQHPGPRRTRYGIAQATATSSYPINCNSNHLLPRNTRDETTLTMSTCR